MHFMSSEAINTFYHSDHISTYNFQVEYSIMKRLASHDRATSR